MERLHKILFAALFTFCFSQCIENQKDNNQKGNNDATFVQENTEHLSKIKITPSPDWFCSSIEVPTAAKVQRAVGGKSKFWPVGTTLKIGFIGGTASQIAAVKQYAPEWTQYANLKFEFATSPPYDIRIAFNSANGAWSYVGTDNKSIQGQTTPTMNLGWIGRDVICHEFGHAIGLFHEHQNPTGGICWNEPNVISDLSGSPNNWTVAMIRFNVLDKLDPATVLTSPWDKNSIMHYPIPASWTCNNVAIPGGAVISQADKDFIKLRYPGAVPPTTDITLTGAQIDNIVSLLNARQLEADTMAARLRRSNDQIKKSLKR